MASAKWTEAELDASVKVYLEMLSKESEGISYKKSEYRNRLLESVLKGRTAGAFEFRMQNISYVLNTLGRPYIKGYLPAKNVGTNTIESITQSLERNRFISIGDLRPTPDNEQLEHRTQRIRKTINLKEKPTGQEKPQKIECTTTVYYRDPEVRAWILESANGKCEACDADAPFVQFDGSPFLEVHHMIPLASGGPDTIKNTIALCPNCHRKVHLSKDRDMFMKEIYNKVERLIK